MSKAMNVLFHDTHNFKRKTVVSNVRITPELASELLKLNTANRPISNKQVREYAEQMTAGKWKFNGDNIRISETAKLLDGQHRLLAIVQSGTTQHSNIQTGVKDDAFDVIDNGKARTAADAVAVAGYENYTTLSSAVKLIMQYQQKTLMNQTMGTGKHIKYTNADVIDFIVSLNKDNTALLEECSKFGNKCSRAGKFYSNSTYAAFCYIFSQLDREQAFFFFDLLTSGENISKSSYSMIYILRQKLINMQLKNSRLQTTDKYALLIKSWNYFRKSREIQQLSWQPSEDFPVAI